MTSLLARLSREGRVRALVLVASLCAALFPIAPHWRAAATTPPGWEYTYNLTVSPDYMQYRVWARQAASNGPLIENRFTTEANRPHLFVPFYWFVGSMARWLGTTPERVYVYLGVPLAFGLAMLLWVTVRRFVSDPVQAWWVYLATLIGGGIGGHLKIANELPILREHYVFQRVVGEPLTLNPVFEDYRSHYVVKTLLDTHFLLIWIVALAGVVLYIEAVRRPTVWRGLAAAALFAASTALHVYEGVTLLAIAVAILACVWNAIPNRRASVGVLGLVTIATVVPLGVLSLLFERSGLPMPPWRALPILPLTLLLAYPVAWWALAWGGRDLWRRGRFDDRALLGWALGCTVVTLSAPFYPYPDRGTMTMQVPLMILAGLIYFARWPRLTMRAALVAILVMGATPLWLVARTWRNSGFRSSATFAFLSPDHQQIVSALTRAAAADAVLAADGMDLLWLAPEFPGRLYAGHFFLTVDYEEKAARWQAFLNDSLPDRRLAFLRESGTRYFFVAAEQAPASFASLPGVTVLARGEPGWLFEYRPGLEGQP
ncbi:MAG TPA: hypothetical protein VF178_15930 [Gemmatimonadaceae bacterium]